MIRRAARELALKILFQIDVGKIPLEEALATSLPEKEHSKVKAFATQLVAGTVQALEKIDRVIGQYAIDW
ncbi:MAG: transcription antitermination factor NusB, partial [Bacillota bacterium]|nr:transcription antitermination factor NusB [Bacillota bacterium]